MDNRRLRTVNTAYDEIVKADPGTALTKHALRNILSQNLIPSINLGHKIMFYMDDLEALLNRI